jgi:hypothetical protein
MNFSISEILTQAWELWKKHVVFTWMLLGVMFVISIFFAILDPKGESAIVSLISVAVSVFIQLGVYALLLKLVRTGEEGKLEELAGQRDIYWRALGGMILLAILVSVGLVFFIIPGIYLAMRFFFVPYLFVDKKLSIGDAFAESTRLTDGMKMNLFGFTLVLALINFVGVLLFIVGLLVTIPLTGLATVMLYDKVVKSKDGTKDVAEEVVAEATPAEVVELPAENTPAAA